MKTRQYQIDINAPASRVMDIMLREEIYKLWTAAFDPTSGYEGEWKKGNHIYFICISKKGIKQGMVLKL